jgi:hypothetical protein
MSIQAVLSDIHFAIWVPPEEVLVLGLKNIFWRFRPFDLAGRLSPELKVGVERLLQGLLVACECSFDDCSHAEKGMKNSRRKCLNVKKFY